MNQEQFYDSFLPSFVISLVLALRCTHFFAPIPIPLPPTIVLCFTH